MQSKKEIVEQMLVNTMRASDGMADIAGLEPAAERCRGSSPLLPTTFTFVNSLGRCLRRKGSSPLSGTNSVPA